MAPAPKETVKEKVDEPCREADRKPCIAPEVESIELDRRYDDCVIDFVYKTTAGLIIGTMFGSFFLRGNLAKWPKFVCGGLGFGMAYSNCENSLNEYLAALSPKLCTVKKKP